MNRTRRLARIIAAVATLGAVWVAAGAPIYMG